MGTVENETKIPAEGSLPSPGNSSAQGSEKEEKDHRELSGVAGDKATENVVVFSGPETKVSVLRESDSQGLADSDLNGVSSLLKMRETSSSDRRKSEEEEKGDDGEGKILTIDVPILEASENMEVEEVEDLGDEGNVFSVGDFVWGKIKSHPWWPGRIYDPSDASDLALKMKQKNRQLLVAYFGDGTFAWCHPSQLKPFEENFDDMVKQSGSRAFVNAVEDAVNHVEMLLSKKMSCSFVGGKTVSEINLPLAKNAGIKEGVIVPENGIERLSAVTIEPPEVLSRVEQFAEAIAIASILELGILKAQLSAFYLSKGGYKLPEYEDPQPVPGFEDSSVDETVDVGNSKSAVEAPVQGPFEEDYSASAMSPKFGESQGLSGNRSNRKRKQKSMAEIMGEDKNVHGKNVEGDIADETIDSIRLSGRKRRRENEDATASKPVQKKKELMINTDGNVSSAENKDSRGKDQAKEVKEAFDNENERSPLSRERKKSKYLSPPFTTPIKGQRKGDIEAESPNVSGEARASERTARPAGQPSPRIVKCNGEAVQENDPMTVDVERELSDTSNHQTEEDEKKAIDPQKVQVTPSEVLSEMHNVAISPQISRASTSLVDFFSTFRSSLYREGSLYNVYQKCRPGRKRKKPENDTGVSSRDQNQYIHPSSILDVTPKKRRKKGTPATPKSKKGTGENASAAALFVSFWPGSTLPSTSDLIAIFSKFGALNEEETEMFRTNFTARVCFLRTSDAETALLRSQEKNPFESAEVTFKIKYFSRGSSKSGGEHGEGSKSKSPASAKKKEEASDTPQAVSLPQDEASRLNYIKERLQGLTSMLEASDGKTPDVKEKVVSGMKVLLENMDKMVGSSSS